MSIIVEDGSGRSDAESYLSVADADTYHAAHGAPAAWTGAGTSRKEQALRAASEYVDFQNAETWKGVPATGTQRLAWPRQSVSLDGYWINSAPLPRLLRDAVAELALADITETSGLYPNLATPGDIKSESKSLGSLSKSVEYVTGKSQSTAFRKADALVRPLTLATTGLERS